MVLSCLHANMKCNLLECKWFVKETDFLGFWMTPEAIKPWRKQVEAILNMDWPKNITGIWAFMRAVSHYKFLWPQQAYVFAPLAELTGREKFQWTSWYEYAFQETKAIITKDAINTFPDYLSCFNLHQRIWLSVRNCYHPVPETNCLLQQKSHSCLTELHCNRKGIVSHCYNPQELQKYAHGIQNHCVHWS